MALDEFIGNEGEFGLHLSAGTEAEERAFEDLGALGAVAKKPSEFVVVGKYSEFYHFPHITKEDPQEGSFGSYYIVRADGKVVVNTPLIILRARNKDAFVRKLGAKLRASVTEAHTPKGQAGLTKLVGHVPNRVTIELAKCPTYDMRKAFFAELDRIHGKDATKGARSHRMLNPFTDVFKDTGFEGAAPKPKPRPKTKGTPQWYNVKAFYNVGGQPASLYVVPYKNYLGQIRIVWRDGADRSKRVCTSLASIRNKGVTFLKLSTSQITTLVHRHCGVHSAGAFGPVYSGYGVPEKAAPSAGVGKCAIATAAYGTPQAVEINVLRRFRDERLLPTWSGRAFVNTYYKVSPPIAKLVAMSEAVKRAVRALISPLVKGRS